MKSVLVYVLSSAVPPYPELRATARETWARESMDLAPTMFFTSRENQADPYVVEFDVPEGLYNMGRKDLLAYDWALQTTGWDYMARVNASCYVSKRRLIEYVQNLPHLGLFQGVGAPRSDGQGMYLWGGAQFLMSRDVVRGLVENQAKWNHAEMEDQAMSRLVEDMGVPLDMKGNACSINKQGPVNGKDACWLCISYANGLMGGFEFADFAEFAAKNTSHFIRVKQDGNRDEDMRIMRELYKNGV